MSRIQRMRTIKCPLCRDGRLLDAAEHADLGTLHLYPPTRCAGAEWFVKCPACRQQIGIAVKK